MFLCAVLNSFSAVCEKYDDVRCAQVLCEKRKKLLENIEKHGFDYESGYYLRAYTDSGRKIGVKSESENKIELLPQAFAVFSAVGTPERRADALDKAFDQLYDSKNRIMKLFSPAYKDPDYDPGYIKGYCEGFRENGGQYTHAAVWMMMSLMEMSLEKSISEQRRKAFLEKGPLCLRRVCR
jgi:cyclic beta-1,2-glucan synthetase